MSYEGYEVFYCKKGHRIRSFDAHETWGMKNDEVECPICGKVGVEIDFIDQTNGCFCDELGDKGPCPCHETKLTVIGWDPVVCNKCEGKKYIKIVEYFKDEECFCSPYSPCSLCHDTKIIKTPFCKTTIDCPNCKGRGVTFVERYDVSPLKRNVE